MAKTTKGRAASPRRTAPAKQSSARQAARTPAATTEAAAPAQMAGATSVFGQPGYEALVPLATQRAAPVLEGLFFGDRSTVSVALPGDADQFAMFRIGGAETPIIDLTEVEPEIEGSDAEPDVRVRVSLLAFHLGGTAQRIDKETRATLRLDLGKDRASNSPLEPLFWSIAAGLDLYDHVKSGSNASDPKRMNDDFSAKFLQRPVEIPGGLGQLRIEIMAHPELPWWRRALGFLGEDRNVRRIVTSVGFPGIALDAVQLLDEMIGRFEDVMVEPLLRSRPLTLAFSRFARDDFTGGSDAARIGCVSPGFYVLVRHADAAVFREHPPLFLGHTGHLVPRAAWEAQPGALDPEDGPYRELTYAVLRFRARAAQLGGL